MQIFLHLPPLTNVRHQKLTAGWRRWPSLCESTNPPPSREPTRLPYSSPSPPPSQPLWHLALLHRSCQASLHLRSLPYPHASRLSTLRRRRPSQCPMESRLYNQPFRWLALHLRRWWPTCSVLPRIISPSRYLCKCPRCTSSLHPFSTPPTGQFDTQAVCSPFGKPFLPPVTNATALHPPKVNATFNGANSWAAVSSPVQSVAPQQQVDAFETQWAALESRSQQRTAPSPTNPFSTELHKTFEIQL